jgi:RNA polymerase sigma-70 factor (ECF subfamily)
VKDEADDLFQEVALRFCQNARELNNGVHLLPWFQTVLLNCHYSGFRKRNLNREIPLSSLYGPRAYYDNSELEVLPDKSISASAIVGEISCLLSVLNPLEKMIVELSLIGGLTLEDLGELIGISKASVTRRRLIAYQKMREKMGLQKDQLKMITGREVSLREIIEYAG